MSSSDSPTQHDDALFSILKDCKTLPVFLDHVFGFLNRRTDFYYTSNEPISPVGLPPGFAERIVKKTFFKWKSESEMKPQGDVNKAPPAVEEVDVSTTIPQCTVDRLDPEFTSSECYNGAVFDTYTWSQTLLEVDVIIKIPENTTWKDLDVKILPDKISVKLKTSGESLLSGDLCQKCKNNEAIWSVNDRKLEIHLDKSKGIWWDCLVQSEPKLDVNKLDCSRPYEELPEEAQAKISELQWNQERKRLGLPTSEEISRQNVLKEAWGAEGSPFSGPFDLNAVKFN